MVTAVNASNYIIGKARVGVRAVGVLTPYTVIPTIEDTVVRLNAGAELFDPSIELDVGGPVQGFQYQPRAGGIEVEFSIAQLDATNLGILLPGSSSVTSAVTAAGTPLSTTSSAATIVGDTSIPVLSVTNATVGDYIKIDLTTNAEYRRITAINSLVISFFEPLAIAHASGVAVTETVGDGRTTFTPAVQGRIATASYQEFAVAWPHPDSSWGEVVIYRGLAKLDSPYELSTGARTMGRARVTITGYRNPADVDATPFVLIQ